MVEIQGHILKSLSVPKILAEILPCPVVTRSGGRRHPRCVAGSSDCDTTSIEGLLCRVTTPASSSNSFTSALKSSAIGEAVRGKDLASSG